MIMVNKFKQKFKGYRRDDVYYLDSVENFTEFSELYTKVRKKERRLYDDQTLVKLPVISKQHPLHNEWKMRGNTLKMLKHYLQKRLDILNILDLGCGNGWMSNKLSGITGKTIFAVDVNNEELKQAARVFRKDNLIFIHADIFKLDPSFFQFDAIIISGALSYFFNPKMVLENCLTLLKTNGELHMIDNLFYSPAEIENAKKRSENYFAKLGYPEMSKHFYHLNKELLKDFQTSIIYKPNRMFNKIRKIINGNINSPATWYCIRK